MDSLADSLGTALEAGALLTGDESAATGQEAAAPVTEPAQAEGPAARGWRLELSPYLWASSMSGRATVGPVTGDVDVSFADVFEKTDAWGVSGRLDAWRAEKWGLFLDGLYFQSTASEDLKTPTGSEIRGEVDLRLALGDFGAGFRVLDLGSRSAPLRLTADVLGGGRYVYFKEKVSSQGLGPLGFSSTIGDSHDWVEPIIGGRMMVRLLKFLSLGVHGDVGGFGIGSASDLSWKLGALAVVHFGDHFALDAGYQVFGLDYRRGSGQDAIGFDGQMHGPVLGLTIAF